MPEPPRRRIRRPTNVGGGPTWDVSTCCIEALCNVQVADGEVLVTADLPYADPENIQVGIKGRRTLEIKAKMTRRIDFKEFGITHREGAFEFFTCQSRIPVPVDAKGIRKEFKRGILAVHLPRKKVSRKEAE